jgi:hypothetical protein
MKKIALLFGLFLFVFACSEKEKTSEEKFILKIENKLKSHLDDPQSYEFVGIEVYDSITYEKAINNRIDMFLSSTEDIRRSLEHNWDMADILGGNPYKKENEELLEKNDKYLKIIHGLDSINKSLGDKSMDVLSYVYKFSFRNKNAFGATVLNGAFIQTINKDSIIIITQNKDELIDGFTDEIPGYFKIVLNK